MMKFDLDAGAAAEATESSPPPAPIEEVPSSAAGAPWWNSPVGHDAAPPPHVDPAIYGIDDGASGGTSPSLLRADSGDRAYGVSAVAPSMAVGAPPSAADSAEVMADFREVNGDVGRGAPPSAADSAEVMEMFREVNAPPKDILDDLE